MLLTAKGEGEKKKEIHLSRGANLAGFRLEERLSHRLSKVVVDAQAKVEVAEMAGGELHGGAEVACSRQVATAHDSRGEGSTGRYKKWLHIVVRISAHAASAIVRLVLSLHQQRRQDKCQIVGVGLGIQARRAEEEHKISVA